jgi:hypothetical protein
MRPANRSYDRRPKLCAMQMEGIVSKSVVAALHLGQHEGDELRYIGKVGTGFTRKSLIENRRKLDAITTAKSPLTKPVRTLKLRGSSRNMWRKWNTATALRKATSGIARSRACARIVESRRAAIFAAILTRASSLHAATTACSRSFAAGLSATQCRRRLRHPAARRHPPRRARRGPAPFARRSPVSGWPSRNRCGRPPAPRAQQPAR